jgi:outer membrane receptor protein involved in Fe transport
VEAVVVRAARLPDAPGEAAYSVVRLTPEALKARERLDEALSQVPAASLFRRTSSVGANPTTQGLSLRAFAPSGAGRALVTLDGVPQNDPFGGWVIWTALPSEDIAAINVVRGAGAGPYGAGALTGDVRLEERAGQPGLLLDLAGGSLGFRRAAGVMETGGAIDLTLTGATEHDDGWIPVRVGRGAADDALTLDAWTIAGRAQTDLGPAVAAVRAGAFSESRSAGLVGANSRTSGQFASVTLVAQPTATQLGWRLQGWVRGSNLRNTSVSVAPGHVSDTPANDQYDTPALGWGLNGALRGQAHAVDWELGADLRAASGEDHEHASFLSGAFTKNRVTGGDTLVAGAYLEADRHQGPWLFSAGGRLDYWSATNAHRVETSIATGAVTLNDLNPDRHGVLPTARAGVRRAIGDDRGFLRAAAYAGFRPPTLNELHRPFRVGNDITESNPALKPERLYGVEAGAGQDGRRGGWSLTGFYNQLRDPVTNVTIGVGPGTFPIAGFVPAGGTLRQRQNAGRINAYGLEGEGHWKLAEAVSVHASGAWTHARVDGAATAPQLTGKRPAEAPALTLLAGGDWRPIGPITLTADLRYESARFEDDINSRPLAAATTVALQARWTVSSHAELYVAADNLFDAAVQTAAAADGTLSYGPPRTVRVGLRLRQ